MIRTESAPFLLDRPVSQFVAKIRHIRMLEAQREYAIAKRWREDGDREAERLLIASQLRLVVKIAWGYRAYGIPFSKLICEGNIGLMEAVKRFDPDHGIRLATYSTWRIHAAILDCLRLRDRRLCAPRASVSTQYRPQAIVTPAPTSGRRTLLGG
ncbi:RNA polymerase sigma factor, sigma-70 family [Rhizobiales bacterium GAS188]|nr:RNA polymerase sigma factor, sigma-70 family [Rhizobiales bacterium GAS188]